MRNVALMLLSAFFFSCEDPINIAVDTPATGGQFVTTFTDTLMVASATVMLDSVITSSQTGAIVGNYKDPVFGKVSAKLYTQLTLPYDANNVAYAALVLPDADKDVAVYDSMYVYLVHNGFVYGDSTKPITLSIHRLTDDFVKGKRYTNNDALGYNTTPLVSKVIQYKDFKRAVSSATDSLIKFKLPDAVGSEIFALCGKDAGTDIDKFTAAVKGLAIVSSQDAGTIYGISVSNSYPQIYYHRKDETVVKGITLSFLSERFSEIKGDKQGTVLQNLKQLESIPSKLTGNKTYIQSGFGITTKISFPTLANLLKSGNVAINKAELIIEPDLDQITGNFKPSPQVALVEIGTDNRLKKVNNAEDFIVLDGGTSLQYVSDYSATNNNYKFNFTSYVQDLLNNRKKTDGIAIVPSLVGTSSAGATTIGIYNNSVARTVIKKIRLNVYYSGRK